MPLIPSESPRRKDESDGMGKYNLSISPSTLCGFAVMKEDEGESVLRISAVVTATPSFSSRNGGGLAGGDPEEEGEGLAII